MWIVYIGGSLHSAWSRAQDAEKKVFVLKNLGKTGVSYRYSSEFKGQLDNGHHFGEY